MNIVDAEGQKDRGRKLQNIKINSLQSINICSKF